MKVGILTLHFSFNYGAVLQAYALQEVLRGMGHQPEFLNFRPQSAGVSKPRPWFLRFDLLRRNPVMKLLHGKQIAGMRENFESFRARHLQQSAPLSTEEDFRQHATQYDALVVGSDQVWNCASRIVPEYFLDFAGSRQRRISYAACCGQLQQLPQVPDIVGPLLARFDHLSVRNALSFDLVRQYAGREAIITADPTLLHDYAEMLPAQNPLQMPYVLCYSLDQKMAPHAAQLAHMVAGQLGLPVVSIVSRTQVVEGWLLPEAQRQLWDVGPQDWLALFRHADFVCTDSFHGMIFGAKFKRPMIAYHDNGHRASRLLDMGRRYSLEHRLIPVTATKQVRELVSSPVDYSETHAKMQHHAGESRGFLLHALTAHHGV